MKDLLTIMPVIILSVYCTVRIIYGRTKQYWWMPLITLIGNAGIWILINAMTSWEFTNLIGVLIWLIVSFELLQVRNHKMSLLFHCLFFLTATVVAVSSFVYPAVTVINEYILMLAYFLTECNQHYIKKTFEESATEYQNKILTKQVNEVQNIYQTMRGWRHDYHNHLQTLKAHLQMNQFTEARLYLDKLELDLDSINHLIETGNINLDAILNSKLSLALKEDIEVNYKAEVPPTLTVSDIDLCVLIGNLIDNAVEACDKISEQEGRRFIRLYIGVLKKQLYISVSNATNEVARKLDEEYITTKRGNHGHGLKRINIIVDKYEGYINRKNEPGVFVTEIMLPL